MQWICLSFCWHSTSKCCCFCTLNFFLCDRVIVLSFLRFSSLDVLGHEGIQWCIKVFEFICWFIALDLSNFLCYFGLICCNNVGRVKRVRTPFTFVQILLTINIWNIKEKIIGSFGWFFCWIRNGLFLNNFSFSFHLECKGLFDSGSFNILDKRQYYINVKIIFDEFGWGRSGNINLR